MYKDCKKCNKRFYKKDVLSGISSKKWEKRLYCSRECLKSEKLVKRCKNCGEEYDGDSWVKKMSLFCSRSCYVDYQNSGVMGGKNHPLYGNKEIFTGENNPNWKGGKPKCVECGCELPSRLYGKRRNKKGVKCSSCYLKSLKLENHPMWKGGISFELYPGDWKDDIKDTIRKRDNCECQECGIEQEKLDRKLDVHHIDYNKHNLDPKNLISLCRKCHARTNTNRNYWQNELNKLESSK